MAVPHVLWWTMDIRKSPSHAPNKGERLEARNREADERAVTLR